MPGPALNPEMREQGASGFIEPKPWDNDGGVRREPVIDTDHRPPRVVRFVGWRSCMCCRRPFWSEDTKQLRMCGGCKSPDRI